MDVEESEMELYQLIEEFKSKPAMVIAKLYLISKSDETYVRRLNDLLIEQLELFSETGGTNNIAFQDVYDLVNSINRTHKNIRIKISHILHSLRTNANLITHEIEDFLNDTIDIPLPRFLVCRAFCSLMIKDVLQTYQAIARAFEGSNILHTRSVLYSFDLEQLDTLRETLIDGRKDGVLICTCSIGHHNMSFSRSITCLASDSYITTRYSKDLEETSFTSIFNAMDSIDSFNLCNLHRVISELDEIIDKLKARSYDATPIYMAHKRAQRYGLARSFSIKYKTRIQRVNNCSKIT